MRIFAALICICLFAPPVRGATSVTVAQLKQFLTSSRSGKLSDAEMANRLSRVQLSEQLTAGTLNRIRMETTLGANSEEQLDLLAAASLFEAPPQSELSSDVAPNAEAQRLITGRARDYAKQALHLLPDFVAVRSTRYFTNVPRDYNKRAAIQMHLTRESKREIAFQDGHEVKRMLGASASSGEDQNMNGGLSTWGEFGAILKVVLGDSTDATLQWSRWQASDTGAQLAVFRYAIPRSASHYTVDFCCFQKSLDEPVDYEFHDKPGYTGEIYIDPANGEITRITLDAKLNDGDPVTRSAIAVQYGRVPIGGKQYVCPLWSIAISDFHNSLIEKIDGTGTESHLNETEFTNYHKFGSSSRILTGAVAAPKD